MNPLSKIFTRFSLLALVALVFASAVNGQVAANMGKDYEFTRISGNSMLPTLKSGETAMVYKAYPFKKLRVGDIVIIESEKGYSVIHRIIRRYRGRTWVTQGDNNRHEDREVLTSNNFRGLALVDQSMVRYQKFLAQNGQTAPQEAQEVAMASTSNTSRMGRLRNL
jgi:signal peptidase I